MALESGLDQTSRFESQMLLQLIEVRSSYLHYNALVFHHRIRHLLTKHCMQRLLTINKEINL
jgi:hypothetical protein